MTTAHDNLLWASTLVEALIDGGVRHVVISPGSRSTPLVLAFARRNKVTPHVILDERAAGFFALGLARTDGQPVALVCTSGSAGAHYLPAVIEANLTRVPLLLLTADRPPELQGCGAPQTIDQNQLFGAHVRRALNLAAPRSDASPRWLRTQAARALMAATGSPPGPVHINFPFRKPLWEPGADEITAGFGAATILRGPATLPANHLQHLAQRLEDTPNGVFVCGPWWPRGGGDGHMATALGTLAAKLGWPIVAEPTSQVRFGHHDRSAVIASADALLRDTRFAKAHAPDCIVQVGQAPTSKYIGQWVAEHGQGKTVLIDPDGVWRDPTHNADTLVVADPALLFEALAAEVKGQGQSQWLARWRHADEVARGVLDGAATTLWEGPIAAAVAHALPDGAALHVSSSMPIRDLDGFAPSLGKALAVLSSRGANGIDGTIATALGEAAGWSRPTALLIGDLAFLHDAGGLLTCQGDLTIVVVNNDGGGIFGFLPIANHPQAYEPYFTTRQHASIEGLCQAAGVVHQRVKSLKSMTEALQSSLNRPGIHVVEVIVDAAQNIERHHQTWRAVSAALEGGHHE